jgi:histidinol-phosphatase (PHP family)
MYKHLGGKINTVGSNVHIPEQVGYKFNLAEELLKELGFEQYSIFENQKVKFYKF